jgi:import inner membrane translocase subunit TIM8
VGSFFEEMRSPRSDLGSTPEKIEIERSQRSASAVEKHAELSEQHMALRARVRGLLALMSSTSGDKRMKFVNRDFSPAIHIRRRAVLTTRPAELTGANLVRQLLTLEVCLEINANR